MSQMQASQTQVGATRLARLRQRMAEKGYDAVVLRNNPDLRWLTGSERTFDFEIAHTAFITATDQWLHTDSRYYNTFMTRLGQDTIWKIDMDFIDPAAWTADRIAQTCSRVVAVEDTVELSFYDDLQHEIHQRGNACMLPRLHGDIATLRIVKDDEELVLLRRAQEITDEAFEYICTFIKPGMTEQDIRVELDNYMLTHGADTLSFDTIIAGGSNGANPHALPGNYKIQEGDFLVMDYGAGYRDYHADMTRTVCVGTPSAEQKKVYDIVRLANETAAAAVKPGVIGKDIHNIAVKVISDAGYGEYFGHGLGHGVGLEIHEQPGFNRSYAQLIPEGSVVTIEPGIYLPGKFGVRIEDCGVVTQAGYDCFTASPHELVCLPC